MNVNIERVSCAIGIFTWRKIHMEDIMLTIFFYSKKYSKYFIVLFFAILTFPFHSFAYVPPIGIPNPANNWGGVDPIDTVTPAQPTSWPKAEQPGYYYIDPTHPNSTDTNNTYGYPDKPRNTIANGAYSPGTYMFLGGQVTSVSASIRFNCSEDKPCWVTSSSSKQGGFSGAGRLAIQGGTQYLFIENLLISDKTVDVEPTAISISNTASIVDSANHIVVRNNTIKNIQYTGNAAVFSTSARDGGSVHDIVFYNNNFTNVGDPYSTVDNDVLCISFGLRNGTQTTSYSYNLFALNNRFNDTGSNGIQVNAWTGGNANLHHIYIGKNSATNTRQKIIGIKQSSHVIVSQNDSIPGINRAAGGVSESFGWSYGPDYVWYIFNNVHDGFSGVRPGDSTGSGGSASSRIFLIGNKIHDIKPALPYDPTNIWRFGTGIDLKQGASTVHIVDNTFFNVYGGVIVKNADTNVYIHGNIFNGIQPSDTFIDIASTADLETVHIANNLYYDAEGDSNWRMKSVNYSTFASLKENYPQFVSDSKNTNPLFVDGINLNFAVQASSDAVGSNKNEKIEYGFPDVYALFESNYGINIRVDYNGNPRPSTGDWTLGAFEYAGASQVPIIQKIIGTKTLTP